MISFSTAPKFFFDSDGKVTLPFASAAYAVLLSALLAFPAFGQDGQGSGGSVIVQPGAPGSATRTLPSSTRAQLPSYSKKDVEFMQGMIMHHAQAVEMVALIGDRTQNEAVRLLGAKIAQSQEDEMKFMRRWLVLRGESVEMAMPKGSHSDAHSHGHHSTAPAAAATTHAMPGMLTPEQMAELARSKGARFDALFLKGMIQHHEGALVMVKDLFDSPGAGQDAELFNFASDVDSGQRAEIEIMKTLLGEKP